MSKRSAEEEIGEATKKQFTEDGTNGNGVHAVEEGAIVANAADEKSAESKPTLYHIQYFSSSRPLFVIHELGIADKINIKVMEHADLKGEEFLAMNPHGTVRQCPLNGHTPLQNTVGSFSDFLKRQQSPRREGKSVPRTRVVLSPFRRICVLLLSSRSPHNDTSLMSQTITDVPLNCSIQYCKK
jgi:hypothetical protein